MLIIGHRGAAGLAPENSLEALRAGVDAGADILEFDIRLTKDKVPIIMHDSNTLRTHGVGSIISRTSLSDLRKLSTAQPILTLDELLDEFFGKILLNIELKSRHSAQIVVDMVATRAKRPNQWDNVIISSFYGTELASARRANQHVNLALLHSINPFSFIAYHRWLKLTAVGFHRLYLNQFALEIARRTGLFIYVYTVNRAATAKMLAQKGIDGIVTDRPDAIISALHPSKKSAKKKSR